MPTPRKAMPLPDGEMLLLTIDRVVERDGPCTYEIYEHGGANRCKEGALRYPDGRSTGLKCPKCHGTGKRRVRVTGWCEVRVTQDIHEVERVCLPDGVEAEFYFLYRADFIKAIIAAHIAGTLPDGVAHIEEADAE